MSGTVESTFRGYHVPLLSTCDLFSSFQARADDMPDYFIAYRKIRYVIDQAYKGFFGHSVNKLLTPKLRP